MIEALILTIGMGLGWFIKPEPAIIPPPASAMARCADLIPSADGTLAEVYRAAVYAGTEYRRVCLNHDELVDWSARTTKGLE